MTDQTAPQDHGSAAGGDPMAKAEATSSLVPEGPNGVDAERVAQVRATVDVSDAQAVLGYGLPAQTRIASFADSLLGDVRNKDAGVGGEALTDLLDKVRELDVDALSAGSAKTRIRAI